MASASTSTRGERPSDSLRSGAHSAHASIWAKAALAALCALALLCFFAFPTYPTYDSLYALLWGRELLHGHLPDIQVYRAPTEHPLAIAFGALCSLFGQGGARLMVLGSIASFVALVAGIWRLAVLCFGPVVAALAGLLVLSRFFVENLALQGFLDVTYAALIVWAAALQLDRSQRGWPVLALLCAAGLLRPEAWLLSALYWLWCNRPAPLPRRIAQAGPGAQLVQPAMRARVAQLGLAALAPALWMGLDGLLTGDPLYSLRSTSGLAQELGRTQSLPGVLSSTWTYAVRIDKLPVVLGAIGGALAALWLAPRRSLFPLALLGCLLAAFIVDGAAGASVLDRYLVAAAIVLALFCAVALGGWSLLERDSLARRAWIAAAAALVLYGVIQVNSTLTLSGLRDTLAYHEELDSGLAAALHSRAVRRSLQRCQLLSLPNNKLIPDVRWMLADAREPEVVARSQARERAAAGSSALRWRLLAGSVAIYPRPATHFFDAVAGVGEGSPVTQPSAGFQSIYASRTYAVYANC
jgi:hypothetical protein